MAREYYDVFLQRNSGRTGAGEKEIVRNKVKENFKKFLKISPNAVEVKINSTNEFMTVGMISEKDKETIFQQNILTDIDSPLNLGELIFWKNTTWIVMQPFVNVIEGYNKYSVLECKRVVKWVDSNSLVHESPCYLVAQTDSAIKESFKTIDNNLMRGPDKVLSIVMPFTTIEKGQKIIIEDTAWEIVETDFISIKGLMYISLTERKKNQFTDSSELNDVTNVGDTYIEIDDLKITVDDSYILNPTLYRNKKQVSCNFIYKISNEEIADITNNTILAKTAGITHLTITSDTAEKVVKEVEIEVIQTQQLTKEISIVGDEIIKPNQTKSYQINYFENGVIVPEAISVIIVTTNGLADYVIDGNTVVLKSLNRNEVGTITIKAQYEGIEKEKIIEMISLWG